MSKQKSQVLILYASTLGGILLGVISSIVNTRYVDPTVYGDVRYVQNILNFTSSLLLVGFFQSGSRLLAINRNHSTNRELKGCLILILAATVAVQVIACSVCAMAHLEKNDIDTLFWISLPVCASPLLLNYINMTAQGDNQIIRLSIARLLPSLIYVPSAYLIYSISGADATKMILLQWGISTIALCGVIISTRPLFSNLQNSWQELKKENKEYGFHLYIGSLVMVATNYIAGISLGAFNPDNVEVGFYTLALTITAPLATLPAIIGTTYFKEFANQPKIPAKVMRATLLLTIASCVIFILVIKPCVNFLYSDRYSSVGTYAMILSAGFSLHGFGDMINRYLGSHGKGKEIRNASIANGILKIIGFTVLVYFFNISGAILTIVACDMVYLGVLLYYYYKFTRHASIKC